MITLLIWFYPNFRIFLPFFFFFLLDLTMIFIFNFLLSHAILAIRIVISKLLLQLLLLVFFTQCPRFQWDMALIGLQKIIICRRIDKALIQLTGLLLFALPICFSKLWIGVLTHYLLVEWFNFCIGFFLESSFYIKIEHLHTIKLSLLS